MEAARDISAIYGAEIQVRPRDRLAWERRAARHDRFQIVPDGFHPTLCWRRRRSRHSGASGRAAAGRV